MTREELTQSYNPSGVGLSGALFGLPFTPETARLVLLPVPWEVTVSYSSGTAEGPEDIVWASSQIDLYEPDIRDAWKLGVARLPPSEAMQEESAGLRALAEVYIDYLQGDLDEEGAADALKELADGEIIDEATPLAQIPARINAASGRLNDFVRSEALEYVNAGQLVGVVGGDHSTPLGLMQALATRHESFAILQIDAHADLRDAYEDFEFSHASIMFNALKIPQVSKLVQVGIRDFAESEAALVAHSNGRVRMFTDAELKEGRFQGKTWHQQCEEIVATLPPLVYLSFDIDGLDPKLCPNTGTPVAGGFEFAEAVYLLKTLVQSGRKIIGFDLCEVSAGESESEWDANVGARLLYKICNWTGVSQGLI